MRPVPSRVLSTLAPLLLALAGCSRPAPELPAGAYLAGDAAALRRVLARLEPRSDVALGRAAAELRQRIEGCVRVYAHSASGSPEELFAAITCAPAELPGAGVHELEQLSALRGDGDLVLVLPLGDAGRLAGPIRVDDAGSVALDARLELGDVEGPAAMLLPGEQSPGPAVLNASDTLLHARLRAARGLAIADWVPAGSQGDQMFRLKSELFAGTALDGTWELAVYMPEPGAQAPPAALALGFRLRSVAEAAAERFVSELRSTWPVQRTSLSLASGEASCLSDLRVLPALAPCWALGERALLVAWNEASLRKALESGAGSELAPDGALVVRLDRFAEADARLQSATPGAELVEALDYAWQRLELRPRRAETGALELSLRLVAGEVS